MKYLKLTIVSVLCVGMATAQFTKGTKSVAVDSRMLRCPMMEKMQDQ